ncbi:hypothetical protein FACS1894177_03000 [Bacteroidia bacterium]|nr:hypothetical protein FACS1894177_03000 [Bacteroidia bacterium]
MQTFKLLIAVLCVTFVSAGGGFAQNIVTYFGQEKIEKTDEGEVFHHFREGLFMPGEVNPGVLYNAQDMIAWLYATGRFVTPKAGESIAYRYPNITQNTGNPARIPPANRMQFTPAPQWKWTEIKADSTGRFQHPQMRSAFLYTAWHSPAAQLALLETTGGTRTYVNGMPHEGDHYDFGYTLIPVKLNRGLNEIVYTPGRFGRVSAKLVKPRQPIMFTLRDMTVPDLLVGGSDAQWAAIRVINLTEKPLQELIIRATLADGKSSTYATGSLMPLSVRKLKYLLPTLPDNSGTGKTEVKLELLDKAGKVIDRATITLNSVSPSEHHTRTFVSNIDGSVQYFGVAPSIRATAGETKGLVLSVHGAGVEARNQANSYSLKDNMDIVAATNRRPYGFNWEDWGRIDALEVLAEAKRIYQPDTSRIYLTGHSMGGHGTWFLGTTYPDRFAAIAPCAGYPDISTYGRRDADSMHRSNPAYEVFARSANTGRTLSLIENLKQTGVYIFHGSADNVVPTEQARRMRETLARFHSDFCYYEYPGGEHWFGRHSMDWFPIFEFFSRHTIPQTAEVNEVDFHTASPAVSASDYWLRVEQQVTPSQFTHVKAVKVSNDTIRIEKSENVALLVLDIPAAIRPSGTQQATLFAGEQSFSVPTDRKAVLQQIDGQWRLINKVDAKQKYSGRYGGFKQAFDRQMVFVYATGGTAEENEWYCNKARFDAETFYYRANGSVEVIADREYSVEKYRGRNVIIYGNRDNNRVWRLLLKDCPIQVSKGRISAGSRSWTGDDLAACFLYPQPESDVNFTGVIAGSGRSGMYATSPNNYISGITGFPDWMIFRADMLRTGLEDVVEAGFFHNDWSLNQNPTSK